MGEQKQDDQLEPLNNSSVPIQNVAWKTFWDRWTIETGGERGSGSSVLTVWHNDYIYMYIYIYIYLYCLELKIIELMHIICKPNFLTIIPSDTAEIIYWAWLKFVIGEKYPKHTLHDNCHRKAFSKRIFFKMWGLGLYG